MAMQYVAETFDRLSGELIAFDLGLWMTLTEFTHLMGVQLRMGRLILAEIGLVGIQSGRYRLLEEHVEAGRGRRLRARASKYPFDVLSPAGQDYARQRWAVAHDAVLARAASNPLIERAADALNDHEQTRTTPMSTKLRVYWLLDHFPRLSLREVARVLLVSEAVVFKWSARRSAEARQKAAHRDAMAPLPSAEVQG